MRPQWGWTTDQQGAPDMPLGDRIRELRKEHGWSQAELAVKIDVDASRISRYEGGHITPSADALVRIAETFDVSIDHLLIDGIPRRPLHDTTDELLGERLHQLAKLGDDDRAALLDVIDAYITRNRLRTITTQAG